MWENDPPPVPANETNTSAFQQATKPNQAEHMCQQIGKRRLNIYVNRFIMWKQPERKKTLVRRNIEWSTEPGPAKFLEYFQNTLYDTK